MFISTFNGDRLDEIFATDAELESGLYFYEG